MDIKRLYALLLVVVTLGSISLANSYTTHHQSSKYFEITKNMEIFTNLYKEINTYYVDDLDPARLMRTGLDAMLESLDPYTNYISESEIEGYRYMTTGKYGGIGASVDMVEGLPTISGLHEGFSAQKAGLRVGDQLTKIDGEPTQGRDIEAVLSYLKGTPGTKVSLTVKRPGERSAIKLQIERENVTVPNVPYEGPVGKDIGYLALTTFTQQAGQNVGDAVKNLKKENPNLKGIILDLRGNGGGLLHEAVNVCNVFVPRNETVVTTKGKVKEWNKEFKTTNLPIDTDIPLVVLIDKGSASASEIVSGVMQDLDRGVLIGQRSYGKGLVQNTRDVGYNSKVKMTIAKYYIPSGRCIQAVDYKDGRPIQVDDSLRTAYYTRNRRPVFDGGGVKPDLELLNPEAAGIMNSLANEHMIFKYATEYARQHPQISSVQEFRFTDYPDFLDYLQQEGYVYTTYTDKSIEALRQQAYEEGYLDDLAGELKSMQTALQTKKKNDLIKHKDVIVKAIEAELAARYYYERGRIEMGLRNDEEIKQAIDILNTPARYSKLLKAQ